MQTFGYLTICIDDTPNLKLWAAVADYASKFSVKTCFAVHTKCISAPEYRLRRQDFSLMREFIGFHEICSHTVSHLYDLEKLPINIVRSELRDSRDELEDGLGIEVPTIVYPRGSYGPRTIRAARKLGYNAGRAVSVGGYEGRIDQTDPMVIGALGVGRQLGRECGTIDLESRLQNLLETRDLTVLLGHATPSFSLIAWKRVIDYASKNDIVTLTLNEIANLVRNERSKHNNIMSK